jgi:hypothetical protein
MTTKDVTAEELIEIIKWTPRTYKMSIWGYGGEIAMGRAPAATVKYFRENLISLPNYAYNYADEGDDDYIDVPEDLQPFTQGSWYDGGDIEHCSGAEFGSCTIQIEDENGQVVWEKELGHGLEDEGCEVECFCEEMVEDHVTEDTAVFLGQSTEKGTFFEGDLELREPFDPAKFKFTYNEIAGWPLLSMVEYDGEEIDGSGGYSTNGKGSDFKFFYLEDGQIEEYCEPTDEELGVPEYGSSPSDWEKTVDFKFKKVKPTIPGWYSAVWSDFGTSYGSLYWNGTNFVEFNYGKERVMDKHVETWSGYNWDTADWSNQPPEPPLYCCDNKKCDWVGSDEERREEQTDDDYSSHCPKCDSTDWSCIDYNPNTAEGRKNRAKYCIPAVPKTEDYDMEQALEELKQEFETLMVAEETPWTSAKTKPSTPGTYECQFKKMPAWPWPPTEQLTWTGKHWVNDDGDKVTGVKEWRVPQEETA